MGSRVLPHMDSWIAAAAAAAKAALPRRCDKTRSQKATCWEGSRWIALFGKEITDIPPRWLTPEFVGSSCETFRKLIGFGIFLCLFLPYSRTGGLITMVFMLGHTHTHTHNQTREQGISETSLLCSLAHGNERADRFSKSKRCKAHCNKQHSVCLFVCLCFIIVCDACSENGIFHQRGAFHSAQPMSLLHFE